MGGVYHSPPCDLIRLGRRGRGSETPPLLERGSQNPPPTSYKLGEEVVREQHRHHTLTVADPGAHPPPLPTAIVGAPDGELPGMG